MVQNTQLAIGALACCLMLAGCSNDKNAGKVNVSGQVKFNGETVEQGTVTFMSADGDGDSASAHIENGQYSIQTIPGKKKVTIVAYRAPKKSKGPKDDVPHGEERGGGEAATEQYLPAEFNSATKLEYTVPDDGGSKSFELTGKAVSGGGSRPPASGRGRGR